MNPCVLYKVFNKHRYVYLKSTKIANYNISIAYIEVMWVKSLCQMSVSQKIQMMENHISYNLLCEWKSVQANISESVIWLRCKCSINCVSLYKSVGYDLLSQPCNKCIWSVILNNSILQNLSNGTLNKRIHNYTWLV